MTDEYLARSSLVARMKYYEEHTTEGSGEHYAYSVALREIRNAPAADVAPVVHGRWVDNGIPGSMLSGCSMCGFTCGSSSFFYCPICGARMRRAKRGKVRRKYGEILALYLYCVEVRMDARLERLHDGWAIRFPNGGDFAQHAGTYGTNDGFVEPAIGCEADYSPVSLREAEKLIHENRGQLMTPSFEEEQ